MKSSVQRGLRQRFVEAYPGFEPYIDDILPKKAQLDAVKLYFSFSFCLLPTPFSFVHIWIQRDIALYRIYMKKR